LRDVTLRIHLENICAFQQKTETAEVGIQAETTARHASDDFARHVSLWVPT